MFRFTIRDVLWLTVVVGFGVGWWINLRTTNAARASLESMKRELDSRRASMDKEWNYLVGAALKKDPQASAELRERRQRFMTEQVTESELQKTIKRSAELGAPQPKPLPPGYGTMPKLDTTKKASPDDRST